MALVIIIVVAGAISAMVDDDEESVRTTAPVATTAPAVATTRGPCVDGSTAAAGIASGLQGGATGLSKANAVELDRPEGTVRYVVAAEVDGPGELTSAGQYGAWGVSSLEGGGAVWALDSVAERYSEWLADAAPGSRADRARDAVAARPETAIALRCVSG